jgi:hypothetical protein
MRGGTLAARQDSRLATKLSSESGFGEVLHSNSFHGRVQEFGSLTLAPATASPLEPSTTFFVDESREYPVEGADAQGASPEEILRVRLTPSSIQRRFATLFALTTRRG